MSLLETTSSQSTWIEIDRQRLILNLEALKQQTLPNQEILAVIKANAYGHGLVEVAKTLEEHASYLGVSCLREADELRQSGIDKPTLVFGRLFRDELLSAVLNGLTLSVSSVAEAIEISEAAVSLVRKAKIHIKVDTGMGRMGIPFKQAYSDIEHIHTLPGLDIEGIYTHLPTAERNDGYSRKQLKEFALLIESLEKRDITFRYRHASNSAGVVCANHPILNLVRPGLMLYGIYPHPVLAKSVVMHPVLSLKSRVILTKRLKVGESSGYGRDFVAGRETTIAVLPIGYSHGYPYNASGHAFVLFKGKKYPLAGRVSMDYLSVEFGNADVAVGDEVTLIGESGDAMIRAENLASWSKTIPYEISTRLIPTLPRIYK